MQNNIADAEEFITTPEITLETDSANGTDISIEPVTEEVEVYVLEESSINTETPTKEDILHMMLNSIDYYNYASGTVAYANPNDLSCAIIVDFQIDIPRSESYWHIVQKSH
ncbi:MAG: hypothetical protein LUI05_00210 [Oscillospiraceae bacterium]|nr:hypothetical protein [Oscillospiraceae bacterium]